MTPTEDSGDDGVGLEMTEISLRNPMKLESSGIKFERSIDEPIPTLNCDTIKDKKKMPYIMPYNYDSI